MTGSARNASTIAADDVVDQAPEVAHRSGRGTYPTTTPSSAASGATMRTSRAPAITREKHIAAESVGAEQVLRARRQVAPRRSR